MTGSPGLGERLGAGGSAEVFAYGEGRVVKLFRPRCAFAAEIEASRTCAVNEAGIAGRPERLTGWVARTAALLLKGELNNPDADALGVLAEGREQFRP